jgi:hypothetical protein
LRLSDHAKKNSAFTNQPSLAHFFSCPQPVENNNNAHAHKAQHKAHPTTTTIPALTATQQVKIPKEWKNGLCWGEVRFVAQKKKEGV